jgi:hypothetical protein
MVILGAKPPDWQREDCSRRAEPRPALGLGWYRRWLSPRAWHDKPSLVLGMALRGIGEDP